ncbi:hypothetical protein LS73_004205 [Helicobacter muridarum]|uniref:Periplasmic protein n=1 Tax=Helicobacter muridarum TaxID=216 RepID=A0A377PSM4_9HELI|nr:hypothetical protein [Helicobacter muridarum]TLE00618.1 hypothetical protein LS73_004205 [Helicobacter muridarum]STQ85635.1 periplasmic protein [Helicobacter muridarum]
MFRLLPLFIYMLGLIVSIIFIQADTLYIDCNDLYGECNPNAIHNDESSKNNKEKNINQKRESLIKNTNETKRPTSNTASSHSKNHDSSHQSNKQPNTNITNFIPSGSMPPLGGKKKGFLYSVVFISALFDNGVQKQGYGILLKDGYVLGTADLLNESNSYLKSIVAKIQDDSSQSLMCFAMLRLRATDDKLALLRAENYTDIYCNTRPESFYHQRVNLHYWTPIQKGMLKKTLLSRSDKVLFPFVTENNTLNYTSSSIGSIQKRNPGYGIPLFSTNGDFVGFLHSTGDSKNPNAVISSDEVHQFICSIAKRKLLPITDLIRPCLKL